MVKQDQQIGAQKFVNMRGRKQRPFSVQKGRQIEYCRSVQETHSRKGVQIRSVTRKPGMSSMDSGKIVFTNWYETSNFLMLEPERSSVNTIDAVTFPLRHL